MWMRSNEACVSFAIETGASDTVTGWPMFYGCDGTLDVPKTLLPDTIYGSIASDGEEPPVIGMEKP